MRIRHSVLPAIRLVVLIAFTALCAWIFGYLWVNSGGKLPFSSSSYSVSANFPRVTNLVPDADVMIAGVKVGNVESVEPTRDDGVHVRLTLHDEYPLHEGASIKVRNKTLVQESFLQIADGDGKELSSGTKIPEKRSKAAVQLNDVLASLNPQTRHQLAGTLRSLGVATKDSRQDISRALNGLGELGRNGADALDALAAQSSDLKRLTGRTAALLSALDTSEGEIARMVSNTDRLTRAMSQGQQQIKNTMRELPGLLDTAKSATGGLDRLSGSLAPVAENLKAAAPSLNAALEQLPQTSKDLRGLLPSLNGVLDQAPETLAKVPMVAADAQQLLPTLDVALADVNPMLSYLQPYGRDIAALFTNMGQSLSRGDVNGKAQRVFVVFNEQTLRGSPLNTNKIGPLNKQNPYPAPGQSANPGPFQGEYPRVQRDGN